MSKRWITEELKQEFQLLYGSETFHLSDAVEFIKSKSVVDIDYKKLEDNEFKRIARYFISAFKDDSMERNVFSCNNEGQFIFVDFSKDLNKLKFVKKQLKKRVLGTQKSYKKVSNRIKSLCIEGQMMMPDVQNGFDNE